MNRISAYAITLVLLAPLAAAEEKRNQAETAESKTDAQVWDSETWDNGSSTTFWRVSKHTRSGENACPTVCNSSTSSLKSGK